MITQVIKTRLGLFALAALLISTGYLLDSSGAMASQALHHVAFIASGVAIGFGIKSRR
jgi:hypothetical protein